MSATLPIFVLGGSDREPGPVPEGVDHSPMLRGFKGAIMLPNGRCLAQEVIDRIRASARFDDPVLLGPADVYRDLVDCRIVDVEGNLADTLSALRDELNRLPDPMRPAALTTCDIVPSADEFREILDNGWLPAQHSCLWGQLAAVDPSTMGSSAWKPVYQFRRDEDSPPEPMYPGHLVIVRPAAIRMRLMNHLLQLAYRHRNMKLHRRPIPMTIKGIGRLIKEDFQNLFRGQLPVLTVSIPWYCLTAFLRFQRRSLSVRQFSYSVMKVFVHRDFHQRPFPAVVFSTTPIRAFAKDIDTEDELAEVADAVT